MKMDTQNERDRKLNEQLSRVIDALSVAAVALEKAGQYANELVTSGLMIARTTREWCEDKAVEVRVEAQHVGRSLR